MISIVIISKDETSLDETLTDISRQAKGFRESSEIIVVDASLGRLDYIRLGHEGDVRWVQFEPPPRVHISIPHQRNTGVRAALGDIIVFTDAGCHPESDWLERLVGPLLRDEDVTAGLTLSTSGSAGLYDRAARQALQSPYLTECATINLAFRRAAFDAIGGFDEGFAYGSDVDFSWRLIDAGYRIQSVPGAVVRHDWGGRRRQLRRSYVYGKARVRLLRKHRSRLQRVLRDDPVVVVYPVFLTGLPLMLVLICLEPSMILLALFYPALLLIPAWRNRRDGVARVLADHLTYGLGVLAELISR